MTSSTGPRAGRWQRDVATDWLGSARAADSLRSRRFQVFSESVRELVEYGLATEADAREVVAHLLPTLRTCDSLSFEDANECLAYICWHLTDRYGRVQQSLDVLFETGHLPLRTREVTLLEVGAGPAPATYAVGDYYEVLADWCRERRQPFRPATLQRPATVDRGPAWSHLVHWLSEILIVQGRGHGVRALPFNTRYSDLQGLSVRQLHYQGIAHAAAGIRSEFETADEFIDERTARAFALAGGAYPPSAYDLIVMCNFLTQEGMLKELEQELQEMSRSLTPGGVLLILGGTGGRYPSLYEAVDGLVKTASRGSLRLVADEDLQALDLGWDHDFAARQLISNLGRIAMKAPREYGEVRDDVQQLDPTSVRYPKFRLLAYKRQGSRALSSRELRRWTRRRAAARPGDQPWLGT